MSLCLVVPCLPQLSSLWLNVGPSQHRFFSRPQSHWNGITTLVLDSVELRGALELYSKYLGMLPNLESLTLNTIKWHPWSNDASQEIVDVPRRNVSSILPSTKRQRPTISRLAIADECHKFHDRVHRPSSTERTRPTIRSVIKT
ncbi:hypothetical protein PYCCODRAFT_1435420 [Trametes coccinea BRFM310]|uniref:Uncharacterized protein n=1 Tax=Trametes coccinea (strain BRFM310) TaxID=1353009 RepID=A0A1Y2IMS3_TRAC3|nr:hypothetical protein PYCCODRAFT_1435420 [Trametes coccinea BRFM310]